MLTRRPPALRRLSARWLTSGGSGGKAFSSSEEAVKDVVSGSKLLVGGFGLTGVPENLLRAINKSKTTDLTVVSSNVGTAEHGLGPLFSSKKISKVVSSYVGENEVCESMSSGEMTLLTSLHIPLPIRSLKSSFSMVRLKLN